MNSLFQPNKWLSNPNLQTIWPNYFRPNVKLDLQTERVFLQDDDFLDICHMKTQNNATPAKGVVTIFHGLGGSINSHYAKSLMQAVASEGLQPIFVHFRGASGEPNKQPFTYHGGKADDIAFVIEKIFQENSTLPQFALGVSIGGSALLNYLGSYKIDNPLSGAIAISVPFDLYDSALQLNKGISKVYQNHLLNCQKYSLRNKFQSQHCSISLSKALDAKSFLEFDNEATAPLNSFKSAMDYYSKCSSKQYLRDIQTPTLLVHAKDDPFMSNKSIPSRQELGQSVELELHERGGHLGFIEGHWPWKPSYYLERRVPEFFLSLI